MKHSLCSTLRSTWLTTLSSISVEHRICSFLAPHLPLCEPVHCLAVGKAAPAMARATMVAGISPSRMIIITTDQTNIANIPSSAHIHFAGHPTPDQRSVAAAEAARQFVSSSATGTLLTLISGGASSLLCAPTPGLSLRDARELFDNLVRSSAPIQHINAIRSALSTVKSGRLLALATVPTLTAVASDVIHGTCTDVGSGPLCPHATPPHPVPALLQRYLPDRAAFWVSHLVPPPKTPRVPVACATIIRPEDLAASFARHLAATNARTTVLHPVTAEDLSDYLISQAKTLHANDALIVTAEPTVHLPSSHGQGGRCGRVALLAAPRLPPNTALLAGASDGVDGTGRTAGACVSRVCPDQNARLDYLRRFDDATWHQLNGTALIAGPTGLNLSDLYVVARAQPHL